MRGRGGFVVALEVPDSDRLRTARHARAASCAAVLAGVFWIYFFIQRCVLGPLNIDEIYFVHMFWLIREGERQFVDFSSNHLPSYFALLRPLVSGRPTDLNFVWLLRSTSVLAACIYTSMLYSMNRQQFIVLLPILFAFLLLARMVEVRPDTFGLLLFNLAWWLLLGSARSRIILAAVAAGLSLLFTARAAVMIAGFAPLSLYLVLRQRDYRALVGLVAVGGAFASSLIAVYLAAPKWSVLVIQSAFIRPIGLMPHVPLHVRLFDPDRAVLLVMIVAAFIIAIRFLRHGDHDRGAVIVAATGTQILLVLLDPSPFQYVYGWAVIPALSALGVLAQVVLVSADLLLASAMLVLSIAYIAAKGNEPPQGSILRLTFDAPADPSRLSTPALTASLITGEMQQGLWNQLRFRTELCRRIRGKVLATTASHPICLRDPAYHWSEISWPAIFIGETARPDRADFYRSLPETSLFIWGKPGMHTALNPTIRRLLVGRFYIYDGFAIAADEALVRKQRRPSRGRLPA